MSYDIYTGLLKAFPLPAKEKTDICFTYDNDNAQFAALKSKYPIEAVAGDGGDFSRALNLLHWVSENVWHKGNYDNHIPCNALDLLNYAYGNKKQNRINCLALSSILSECLLAVGLKARRVGIMPCSPYDGDNHVVSHVFISEMNKWVMLDPTYNAYFTNKQGEVLSLLELRDCLANQGSVFFNTEAKYHNRKLSEKSRTANIKYFAKNLYYFTTFENSSFGKYNSVENRPVLLSPQGYDPRQARVANIEYRIKKYGDNPDMQSWLERAKQEKYYYCMHIC